MEWIKLFGSAKAWEIVVSLVGGYLAAKNLEKLTRSQFIIYIFAAVVFGFAAANFALPWAVEQSYLSEHSAINLKPLAILILAAVSLRLIDLLYGLVGQLKEVKLKDIKLSWGKGKK